jgi:hypothetical protein
VSLDNAFTLIDGHPEKPNQFLGVDVPEWYHQNVIRRQEENWGRVGHPPNQGGRAAAKKALRSYAKRLAQHEADLARYQAQSGYTTKTLGEIKHFQTMIRLAEDWLLKNP